MAGSAYPLDSNTERRTAVWLYNRVWELLDQLERTPSQDGELVHAAHASRWHWGQVGGPEQIAVGEWQVSRAYVALGRAEPALFHARAALDIVSRDEDLPDWVAASAYEGLARALHCAGDAEGARAAKVEGGRLAAQIADPEDRELIETQLANLHL